MYASAAACVCVHVSVSVCLCVSVCVYTGPSPPLSSLTVPVALRPSMCTPECHLGAPCRAPVKTHTHTHTHTRTFSCTAGILRRLCSSCILAPLQPSVRARVCVSVPLSTMCHVSLVCAERLAKWLALTRACVAGIPPPIVLKSVCVCVSVCVVCVSHSLQSLRVYGAPRSWSRLSRAADMSSHGLPAHSIPWRRNTYVQQGAKGCTQLGARLRSLAASLLSYSLHRWPAAVSDSV